MTARKIRYDPLVGVLRAARNPKRHAADEVAASMTRFGFLLPLVVDERTGILIAGHGRLDELERRHAAGEAAPDGIVVKGTAWFVPVVTGWASDDDADADAAAVSLNYIEEAGGWDARALYRLLDRLAGDSGAGLPGTGFTAGDLDTMLAELSRAPVSYGGDGSGARTDIGIGAKAETYRTNGVRSLVLDYEAGFHERIMEAMNRLCRERPAVSKAALVHELLEEAQ